MPFVPGQPRPEGAGRPKGKPNKSTLTLIEKAEELNCDPFEILLRFAKGDWEGLGYKAPTRELLTKTGDVIEIDMITPEMRLSAAEKASQYLYPKRRAIDLKTDAGGMLRDLILMPAEERKQLISAYMIRLAGKNE